MNEASILLLLGCGVVVVAATPRSRLNPNSNIVTRRSQNINSNSNTNIVSDGPRASEEESDPTLEEISGKLYSENDPKTASVATAAAEAALSITKGLAIELGETAAVAVAEAVSRTLRKQDARYNRRNYNVNTNTNTNIVGLGRGRKERVPLDEKESGRGSSEDFLDLGNGLGTGSSDLGLGSSTGHIFDATNFGLPQEYANELSDAPREVDGTIREPDEDEEEEEKDTSSERLAEIDPKENEIDSVASKSLGGQGWSRANRRYANSNARNNRLRTKYETDLRSRAYRPNANSNANSNFNNFRRNVNLNSNSNVNNFRRNVNANANNNRMGRHYRSRRG